MLAAGAIIASGRKSFLSGEQIDPRSGPAVESPRISRPKERPRVFAYRGLCPRLKLSKPLRRTKPF
jgi:hypothetical protein